MDFAGFLIGIVAVALVYIVISFIAIMGTKEPKEKVSVLKSVYVYAVSFISLAVFLVGAGTFLYQLMSTTVFPKIARENVRYELEECRFKADSRMKGQLYDEDGNIREESLATAEEQAACQQDKLDVRVQRDMLSSLIMMLISLPVYAGHYFFLRKKD